MIWEKLLATESQGGWAWKAPVESSPLLKQVTSSRLLRALSRWGWIISEGGEPTDFSSVWLPWQWRNKLKSLVPKENSLCFMSFLLPVPVTGHCWDDNISLQLFSLQFALETAGEVPVGAEVVSPLSPPAEASPVPGCCWQHSALKAKKKHHNELCPAELLFGIIALIDSGFYKGFCRWKYRAH